MATSIDELQIEINGKADDAKSSIDKLVSKLDILSDSLAKIDGTRLNGLANGVEKLSRSMQSMNTVKTTDFTRLAKNLTNLGNVNTQALNSAASSMSHLTRAFNNLGAVSTNAQAVGDMAKNIAKLGNASVQRAITNIPLLATAMNNLLVTLSQSPQVSNNIIKLTNALANLSAQGGKVGTASRSIQAGLNVTSRSADKAKKSFGGLASAFGKFYATYFLAIRGLKGLWSSIQNTADYIEAYNYFNVALGKIGSDWQEEWQKYGYENGEAYADSFATRLSASLRDLSGVNIEIGADGKGILSETGLKNLGLNIQEVTQYAAQLASVTNSVGQTGEVSLAAAESLTKLGADISSLFNIDFGQAMQNLQSGLIGQSRALYKYGIDITNATLQTYAYELGLEKSVSEMTQMEKMQLRILAILKQSKVAWGDLANTIQSPSNMIRQLTNNLREIGVILGQLFIPLLKQALPVINGFTIAIKRLLVNIANFLGVEIDFSDFGKGYNEAEDALEGIADGYDQITEAAEKASKSTRKFDELNVISTGSKASAATAGTLGSIDLTKEILAATEEYNKVWAEAFAEMENTAQNFADNIGKKLAPLEELFRDLTLGDFFQVGEDVSGIVVGITEMVSRAIENVDWQVVGNNFGLFLAGIDWKLVFQGIGDVIFGALEGALAAWQGSFDVAPIETVLLTAIAGLHFTGIGQLFVSKFVTAIAANMTIGNFANTLFAGIQALLGSSAAQSALSFISNFTKGFTGITSVISGAVLSVKNFFDMWENGWNLLDEVLKDIGIALAAVGAVILGVSATPAAIVAGIVAAVSTVAVVIHDNWEEISQFLSNAWKKIKETASGIAEWFNEKVITPVVNFFKPIGKTISDVFEGAWIIIKAVWKVAGDWFEGVLAPIKALFLTVGNFISEKFTSAWNTIKGIWGFASSWINNTVIKPIGTLFDKLWSGIKNGVVGAMNGIIGTVENMLNFFISGINGVLIGFNKVVEWAADIVGEDWDGITLIPEVKLPKISAYATGGFPEDGLFFANHTELVGQFSNGRTAVANNDQITQGIANAVYPAVKSAMSEVMSRFGNQPIRVYVGDRELTEIVVDGINQNYKSTQKSPFAFI